MDARTPKQVVLRAIMPLADIKPILKAAQDEGIEARDLGGGTYEFQAGFGRVLRSCLGTVDDSPDWSPFCVNYTFRDGHTAAVGVGPDEFPARPASGVVRQRGNWILAASNKQALADIPDDPVRLLGGLNERYTLASKADIKNLPAATRDRATASVTSFFQTAAEVRARAETDEQREARNRILQQMSVGITQAIKDLDTILFGIGVDRKANSARLDFVTTFLPGSKSAGKRAKSADLRTDFAGLADPSASIVFTFTEKLDEEDAARAKANAAAYTRILQAELDKTLPKGDEIDAQELLKSLMLAIEKTVAGGKIDGGFMLKLAPDNLQFVAGLRLVETAEVEQAVKEWLTRAAKASMDKPVAINFDAEVHEGIRFHVLSEPTNPGTGDPKSGAMWARLLGEKTEVLWGIGEESLYLACGRDAAKALKEVIDKSRSATDKSTPPMQLSVAVTPIVQLVALGSEGDARKRAEMFLKVLSAKAGEDHANSGKDHVKLTATRIPNGSRVRLEVEEGVLRMLASIPKINEAVRDAAPATGEDASKAGEVQPSPSSAPRATASPRAIPRATRGHWLPRGRGVLQRTSRFKSLGASRQACSA